MSVRKSFVLIGVALVALVTVTPAAQAAFNQDWGGYEDECMGPDDPFCAAAGTKSAAEKYQDCLDKIDYTKSALHVCNAKCSCKYSYDMDFCKESGVGGAALTTCQTLAMRNFEACTTQCYADLD